MAVQRGLCSLFTNLCGIRNALYNRPSLLVKHQPARTMAKYKSATILEESGVPKEPKRPMTAYFRFVQQHRPVVKQQHPEYSMIEVVKQCTAAWKNVDDEARLTLQKQYEKDYERYAVEYKNYTANLSKEQIEAIIESKRQRKAERLHRQKRKSYRVSGRPKGPGGTFYLFLNAQRDRFPGKKFPELMQLVKGEWAQLSAEQRKPYIDVQREASAKYHAELREWEERMILEGKHELVRKKTFALRDVEAPKKTTKGPKRRQQPAKGVAEAEHPNDGL